MIDEVCCVYIKWSKKYLIILLLYVDDILRARNNEDVNKMKK